MFFFQSLSENLDNRCLLPFIEKSTEIVSDSRTVGSVVICNILSKIFDSRHSELIEQVRKTKQIFKFDLFLHHTIFLFKIDYMFSIMLEKYNKISSEEVLRALRGAFKQLSLSCSTRVFSTLMNFGVPFTK